MIFNNEIQIQRVKCYNIIIELSYVQLKFSLQINNDIEMMT